MDTARDQCLQGRIDKPVAGHPGQAIEALAHDSNTEMPSFAGPGMTSVQMAVILHFQDDRP